MTSRFGEIPITPDDQGKQKIEKVEEPAASESQAAVPPLESAEPPPVAEGHAHPPRRVPARKRKGTDRRLLLRLVALLLLLPCFLVLLYVAGSSLLIPSYIKGSLARSIGKRLERTVTVGRAVYSPFTLHLAVEDITIGPAAGEAGEQGLLACDNIEGHLNLDRLFSGLVVWEGIRVRGLTMRINRDAALSSDLAATWRLIVPSARRTASSLWPEWLLPGEISLSGGTLLVDDAAAQKQYQAEQIELYLPPPDPRLESEERLPRLSAVINGSPVQVEAVRAEGSGGRMETRFDLKIKDLAITNYLQALPVAGSLLRLSDGRAGLDLRLIFPETGEGAKRIVLAGSSTLTGVKVVDKEGREVFFAPEGQMQFEIAPLAQRYRFSRIVLDKPRFNLRAGKAGEKESGLQLADLASVLLAPVRTPLNLGIEQLQLNGGKIRIGLPGAVKKELVLDEFGFTVHNFASPGVGLEERKGGPTQFSFDAAEGAGNKGVRLAVEGEILPDGGIRGKGELDGFDLPLYQAILPATAVEFSQGRGALRLAYEAGGGKGEGTASLFRVSEGELTVADYALQVGGDKAAEGTSLRCSGLTLDPAERRMGCGSLELAGSEIFRPGALIGALARPAAKEGTAWRLVPQNVAVKDGKVHVPFLPTLCTAEQDQVLDGFVLDARDLASDKAAGSISGQGRIGERGTVAISGGYLPAQNSGSLQLNLQRLDLALFNPCLRTTLIPAVSRGSMSVQGNVTLPAGEFSGQVSVNDMAAGGESGPEVRWQLATSERVTLRLDPLHLDLGEIMVRKPVVKPGLADSENLLHNFLRPGTPAFQKLAIAKISIEDGQLDPCWPVLLPGYQPRLEGVSGTLSAPGQKTMPFSLSGTVADLGNFSIKGDTSMERVISYSLEMPEISLAPFADFFLTDMGMAIDAAKAKLQQSMSLGESATNMVSVARFQGLQPLAESPLLRASALLLDENGQLQLEHREAVPAEAEPPFLLSAAHRQLQRQAVRVGVSEEMVLRESFPKLQLPAAVSFAPGLAEPLAADGLADYKELLARRPFLRLRLQAAIDEATDREALRRTLQEAADLQREAENSRRALVKLQREQKEKERLAAIKEGKAPVVAEKIEADELAGDLEPLPPVAVQVTGEMLAELAQQRLRAVQGQLEKLALPPGKVGLAEGYREGPPQVQLLLEPDPEGRRLP